MIRQTRLILLVVLALTLLLWGVGANVSSDSQTEALENDAVVITDLEDLQAVSDDPGEHYVFGSDIDASGGEFEPIGTSEDPFTGSLDGNGYTITGLSIDEPEERYVGLFGVVDGGVVENVILEGVTIVGDEQVGALVGHNAGSVIESTASGEVDGTTDVGGLVGVADGEVTRSSAHADVSGTNAVGGLVGTNACGPVTDSWASSDVSGEETVGGLIGENRCTVLRSYAVGSVTATTDAGGAIGDHLAGSVANVYWDPDATGQTDSAAGTARATGELQGSSAETALEGLDFEHIWEVTDEYPILAWEADIEPSEPTDGIEFNGYTAQDLTNDGLHEDLTGSGDVTTTDAVVFFEYVEHEAIQNAVGAFDFAGNDRIGVTDVVALFELVGTIGEQQDQ